MLTRVVFRAGCFGPYPNDTINPDRFGKRFAEFLRDGLQTKGFVIRRIHAEDWGWIISIRNQGFPLWIGCGNYDEFPNGYLCFIEPARPVIRSFHRLFTKIETTARVGELQHAVDELLRSNDGISDIRWESAEG